MRVKKIDIFGFKSFATKQSITFGEGVTAVVGPNGCGKSNVVDALRWVMGEQNPRHLRGGSMQDIIFCGSEKKAPLGFAQVILTIENDKNDAPLEYNHFHEIEISRRLYKTGESEYEINKQKARLKDISDFFLGTGVGTKAYSIIEQGRINDVISAKPADRRLIIEEAAGITKYKSKKTVAERRMEACRLNLSRIVDIKNEVDRRLQGLAREKEKLIKVQVLRQQIKDIDLHMATHHYLALWATLTFLQNSKQQLADNLLENQRSIAFIEQKFSSILHEYSEKHDKQRLLIDLENQHKTTTELLKKDIEYSTATKIDNEVLISRLSAQVEEIDKRIDDLTEDIIRYNADLALSQNNYQAAVEEFQSKRQLGQDVIERRQKHLMAERDCSKKIVDAASLAARLQAEITFLQNQEQRHNQEIRILGEECALKDNEQISLKNRLAVLEDEFKGGMAKKSACDEKLIALEKLIDDQKTKQDAIKKQLSSLKEEQVTLSTRYDSLKEIDDSLSWSDSGIGDIFASDHAHIVRGIVAQVVKAKLGHEDTVEKCLSHILDAALVSNNKDLTDAISLLRNKKSARTAFYLFDASLEIRSFTKPLGLTSLNELVSITHNDYNGLKSLFDHIFVANNFHNALDHWPAARLAQATIVSLEGEILFPDGRVIFLGSDNQQGVLKRKNELLLLTEKTTSIATVLDDVSKQASTIDQTVHHLGLEHAHLFEEQKSLNMGLIRLEETIKQKTAELMRLNADIAKAYEKRDLLIDGKTLDDNKVSERQKLWSEALEEHKNLEEMLESYKSMRTLVESEYDEFQTHLKEIEVKKASLYEKTANFKTSLEQADKNLAHLQTQKQSFSEQIDEKSASELMLKEHLRQTEQKMQALQKERLETENILKKVAVECEDIRVIKESCEHDLHAHKNHKQALMDTSHQKEILINNAHHDINNLCDRINERYRLKLTDFLVDFHHLPLDEDAAKKERDDLKRSADRLGLVNENASLEYDELYGRHAFLQTQVTDLTGALEQLEEAIRKINKATKTRFLEAFNSINKQFSLVFPRLFNGGHAELSLLDDEDLLSCGVQILARPPGKNIGSIELMSGGEKALTAISLIMAIFLIKPSPFCVLDEVDAPLDEANVARFSQLVKEMSKLSQFIVITHNRKTMESADQLYGVTMEDAGQSKIVSVQVQQAFESFKTTPKPSVTKPTQLPLSEI